MTETMPGSGAVALPLPLQLLLLLVQPGCSSVGELRIRDLCESMRDWPEFIALARHHRVVSLVFRSLVRLRPPYVPPSVHAELQRSAAVSSFRILRTATEVARILEAMQAGGFPVKVLKGYPLSQEIYGDPTARQCGDIDLLTTPDRLEEQIDLWKRLGYVLEQPSCRLTPRRLAAYATTHKDFTFRARGGAFSVDLHWRLFHHRGHPGNKLLQNARFQDMRLYGTKLSVLCSLDHFLYVAAHGVSDAWIYLKSLADMGGYLHRFSQGELDAALLRARDLGLLQQVSAAVHIAADWMEIPIASPYLLQRDDAMCQRQNAQLYATLLAHAWKPTREARTAQQWMQQEHSLIPGASSLPDFARRFFYRPNVWSTVDLPDSLFCLYPLLACLIPPRPTVPQQPFR